MSSTMSITILFVGLGRVDRDGKIENRFVASRRVPQIGTENEVTIPTLRSKTKVFPSRTPLRVVVRTSTDIVAASASVLSGRRSRSWATDTLAQRRLSKMPVFFSVFENVAFVAQLRLAARQKRSRGLQLGQSAPIAGFQIVRTRAAATPGIPLPPARTAGFLKCGSSPFATPGLIRAVA